MAASVYGCEAQDRTGPGDIGSEPAIRFPGESAASAGPSARTESGIPRRRDASQGDAIVQAARRVTPSVVGIPTLHTERVTPRSRQRDVIVRIDNVSIQTAEDAARDFGVPSGRQGPVGIISEQNGCDVVRNVLWRG